MMESRTKYADGYGSRRARSNGHAKTVNGNGECFDASHFSRGEQSLDCGPNFAGFLAFGDNTVGGWHQYQHQAEY